LADVIVDIHHKCNVAAHRWLLIGGELHSALQGGELVSEACSVVVPDLQVFDRLGHVSELLVHGSLVGACCACLSLLYFSGRLQSHTALLFASAEVVLNLGIAVCETA
jgi:hypothetical protein